MRSVDQLASSLNTARAPRASKCDRNATSRLPNLPTRLPASPKYLPGTQSKYALTQQGPVESWHCVHDTTDVPLPARHVFDRTGFNPQPSKTFVLLLLDFQVVSLPRD